MKLIDRLWGRDLAEAESVRDSALRRARLAEERAGEHEKELRSLRQVVTKQENTITALYEELRKTRSNLNETVDSFEQAETFAAILGNHRQEVLDAANG